MSPRGRAGAAGGAAPTPAPAPGAAPGGGPVASEPETWTRAALDASGDGYMVWRAERDGGGIADWVVVDANALARERWADVVGDVVGVRASQLNRVADNSRFLELCVDALATGERQVMELRIALPAGRGGWRRTVVTPLDADTVSIVTHDISRERYLEAALERERERAHLPKWSTDTATDVHADARFASRTASVLYLGCGLVAFVNSIVSRLGNVDVGALRVTGAVSIVLAFVIMGLPWERHFGAVANCMVGAALVLIVVSDHFDHYSRADSALAVYPVFFIVLVAWTGLVRPKGAAAVAAVVATPLLAGMFLAAGRTTVGWQSVIVTMPVAAVLGEVLSWTSHRARTLTNVEMQRRLHDPLTGVANRTMLSMRLDQALARVRRSPSALALLYIDVDNFKQINDTLGHNAGDDLLIETAARLRSVARETDTVARMGGDEFVVLCEDVDDLRTTAEIAQRILGVMEQPFALGTTQTRAAVSVGVACSSAGDETAETLLQNADLALYRAKEGGKARFELFGEALRHQVAVRRELESALREAIPRDELRLHYQPIVSAATGQITSFEALVRWERPGYGLVPPYQFIPVAEETGLIVELGAWVLSRAATRASVWQSRWPGRRIGVSVNLSGHQILHGGIVDTVRSTLARTGLDPRLLTLELTETLLIDNSADAEPLLRTLRELGVNLAIDDFGTGYSSLTYLRHLPINTVKIDQTFIRAIGTEREDTAIVAAVINLARNLDLRVVAEGVETPEQLATLLQLNCEQLQGFLFSQPRPDADLDELFARESRWVPEDALQR